MTSCMRLRQRTSVDLPQPDGPITAVMDCGGMCSETSRMACRLPYQAERPCTSMARDGAPPLRELVMTFLPREACYNRARDANQRVSALNTAITAINTSAPPQAFVCQSSYGDSAYA